ncbi:MAG: class I SAM-dependent methyltransferase [Candidatus Electrothrix sp. LOE2]|nr:class I SAM-dependent methyltransferase [Candidatus Electrothrix sp. LOE2]
MSDVNVPRNENEYVEIVDYYDSLLTSGYYDFESLGNTLHDLIGDGKKILDIGVGTGLLTKKMLELDDYEIVGVDFSPGMLERAQERLADSDVELVCEDILKFETEEKFDAVVSSGGAVYMVEEEGEYRLYSHITDKIKNEQLLEKLCSYLKQDGVLALAIQGPHENYRKKIKGDILYEQRIDKQDSYVNKWYTFSKPDGTVLTEQFCRFRFFEGKKTEKIFNRAGFSVKSRIVGGKFWVGSPS